MRGDENLRNARLKLVFARLLAGSVLLRNSSIKLELAVG
jgi:hypothetical protein